MIHETGSIIKGSSTGNYYLVVADGEDKPMLLSLCSGVVYSYASDFLSDKKTPLYYSTATNNIFNTLSDIINNKY